MKFINFAKHNSTEILEHIEKLIDDGSSREIGIDISGLNMFDASRVMLLSSALFYSRYPGRKLTCKVQSAGIKNLIAGLSAKNLEIV